MDGKTKQSQESIERVYTAFLLLLKETPYSQIAISDILSAAEVSRGTFYRYFPNKEAIVQYYFDKIGLAFLSQKESFQNALNIEDIIAVTLHIFYQEREMIQLLVSDNLSHLLVDRLNEMSYQFSQDLVFPWQDMNLNFIQNQYAMEFIIGGYANIVKKWLAQENPEPPEVLQKALIEALYNIIKGFQ